MAGEALTNAFMLGTATVMIGAQADLLNLTTANSIGLVKNVGMKTTPSFQNLTQGVKNTLVYSVMTQNDVKVEGEMYEYTAKNMTYALGLNGTAVTPQTIATTVATAVAAPTPPALSAATLSVTSATGLAAGDFIFVQVGAQDQVIVKKIVSITTNTLTLDSGFAIAIPLNSTVRKVNVLAVGSTADQPFMSAKIVGTMANGDEIVLLLPKVRFTAGLNLAFKTGGFENIPLGLDVFDLVPSDPNYAFFQAVGPQGEPSKAMLLTAN